MSITEKFAWTLLTAASLMQTVRAAKCTAQAYSVFDTADPEQPDGCGGNLLGWVAEDGPGLSPCLGPGNATCAVVSEAVGGVGCTVNLYNGGGSCSPTFLVGALPCAIHGSVYGGVTFDRFDIVCVE